MKHHLYNSMDPAKEGSQLEAVCGEKIVNSRFAMLLDCAVVGYTFSISNIRGLCRKCSVRDLPKRFVYVICNGQEAKTEDAA